MVSDDDTVGKLKEIITEEIGVPARYQELRYQGMVLSDDCDTLVSHNIDLKNGEVCKWKEEGACVVVVVFISCVFTCRST